MDLLKVDITGRTPTVLEYVKWRNQCLVEDWVEVATLLNQGSIAEDSFTYEKIMHKSESYVNHTRALRDRILYALVPDLEDCTSQSDINFPWCITESDYRGFLSQKVHPKTSNKNLCAVHQSLTWAEVLQSSAPYREKAFALLQPFKCLDTTLFYVDEAGRGSAMPSHKQVMPMIAYVQTVSNTTKHREFLEYQPLVYLSDQPENPNPTPLKHRAQVDEMTELLKSKLSNPYVNIGIGFKAPPSFERHDTIRLKTFLTVLHAWQSVYIRHLVGLMTKNDPQLGDKLRISTAKIWA
jgi:hypothetical protein